MVRLTDFIAGVAGALTASVALAQTAPTPPTEPERHPMVQVSGYAVEADDMDSDLVRRVQWDGDPRDWISPEDPAVRDFIAAGRRPTARLALRFEVDADGRAIGCRPEQEAEGYAASLCGSLEPHVRFLPTLTTDGRRHADAFVLNVTLLWSLAEQQRLVTYEQPAPPRPPEIEGWPPPYGAPGTTVTGLALLPGGGGAPEAFSSPWAGLGLHLDQTDGRARLRCTVIGSSGDEAFNARACRAVTDADIRVRRRFTPLLLVQAQGRFQVVLPVNAMQTGARLLADGTPRFRDHIPAEALGRLRLGLEIDAAGRATSCRVVRSSGDDAADIAACRLIRDDARFAPGQDVFGRPRASGLHTWSLPAE